MVREISIHSKGTLFHFIQILLYFTTCEALRRFYQINMSQLVNSFVMLLAGRKAQIWMKERDCRPFPKIHSFFHQKAESYLSSHSSSGFPSKKFRTLTGIETWTEEAGGMKNLNETRKRTVCKSAQRPRHVRSLIAQPTQQFSGPRWLKRLGLGGKKQKIEKRKKNQFCGRFGDSVILSFLCLTFRGFSLLLFGFWRVVDRSLNSKVWRVYGTLPLLDKSLQMRWH